MKRSGADGAIAGRYRLDRLVGRGAVAAVYRARDSHERDRVVAVKVIAAAAFALPGARERFDQGAWEGRQLQHPSIVRTIDHGLLPDGGAYLVMEFVEGEDLRQLLGREGRLPPGAALEILTSMCAGVEAAHRSGVVHGDLKPENVMLPRQGPAAMVADFVDARRIQADGSILGTPAYMSLEQLRGAPPSTHSDIFSLGVIAFEMLTGELPFGRGSLADIVLAHARGVPAFSRRHGLSPALEHAVIAALRADPEDRPPTVRAFAQLLAS